MSTIRLNGTTLAYRDEGSGDAVLFLHAFPLDKGQWEMQFQALTAELRVIAFDARGFGESSAAPDVLTMEQIADDAAALLSALEIPQAVVVGCSMGGYAAFELFRRHPGRVRALVLADTRANADDDAGRANREHFARTALQNGEGWVANEMLPKLLRRDAEPAVVSAARQIIRAQAPAAVAAASRGMARRSDMTALLPRIECPTLVIVGSDDAVTPPSVAQPMAHALPDGHFVQIPEAGHLSNLEKPAAFNGAIADFLRLHLPVHGDSVQPTR